MVNGLFDAKQSRLFSGNTEKMLFWSSLGPFYKILAKSEFTRNNEEYIKDMYLLRYVYVGIVKEILLNSEFGKQLF